AALPTELPTQKQTRRGGHRIWDCASVEHAGQIKRGQTVSEEPLTRKSFCGTTLPLGTAGVTPAARRMPCAPGVARSRRTASRLRVGLRAVTGHVTGRTHKIPRVYRGCYGVTGKMTPGRVLGPV